MGVPGSIDAGSVEQDDAVHAVADVATELLPIAPQLGTELTDHLFATVPELAERRDDELRSETVASVAANVDQLMRLLKLGGRTGTVALPPEAAEYVRGLVQRGIPLPSLLRLYRLGHAWLWDRWSRALGERIADPDALRAAAEHSSAFMFAYVDKISDVVVAEYGSELERSMRGTAQLRADTVRAIVANEPIDEEAASRRLGYELRRHHLALRVSGTGAELRGLERAASEAAAIAGTSEPLIVPSAVTSLDVWCGGYAPADTARLEQYEPPEGIRVAFGTPAEGISGFRRSHEEAAEAARVATLARGALPAVTSYRRVELVALLAGNLPRARAFVARHLGPLGSTAEPVARLRDTVLAYLSAGGSTTRVASELFVHQNTVAYRLKRAEELLGRRITEDSVELTCALTLAAALGPAVLAGDDDGGAA